jgi:hypothetical protein
MRVPAHAAGAAAVVIKLRRGGIANESKTFTRPQAGQADYASGQTRETSPLE